MSQLTNEKDHPVLTIIQSVGVTVRGETQEGYDDYWLEYNSTKLSSKLESLKDLETHVANNIPKLIDRIKEKHPQFDSDKLIKAISAKNASNEPKFKIESLALTGGQATMTMEQAKELSDVFCIDLYFRAKLHILPQHPADKTNPKEYPCVNPKEVYAYVCTRAEKFVDKDHGGLTIMGLNMVNGLNLQELVKLAKKHRMAVMLHGTTTKEGKFSKISIKKIPRDATWAEMAFALNPKKLIMDLYFRDGQDFAYMVVDRNHARTLCDQRSKPKVKGQTLIVEKISEY